MLSLPCGFPDSPTSTGWGSLVAVVIILTSTCGDHRSGHIGRGWWKLEVLGEPVHGSFVGAFRSDDAEGPVQGSVGWSFVGVFRSDDTEEPWDASWSSSGDQCPVLPSMFLSSKILSSKVLSVEFLSSKVLSMFLPPRHLSTFPGSLGGGSYPHSKIIVPSSLVDPDRDPELVPEARDSTRNQSRAARRRP